MDATAWKPKLRHGCVAVLVLLACLVARDPVFRETLRYTLQGAALFVLFSYALHDRRVLARLLGRKVLRALAPLSYTLYLCHLGIFTMLEQNFPLLPISIRGAIGFTLSFAYAGAMYFVVEKPLLEWRRRRKHIVLHVDKAILIPDTVRV